MLISAILFSLVETYLTFDRDLFPIPFERPEVAFQAKRLSKYYDLGTSTWQDSGVGLKQTYSQMLTFCQDMYPDRDVVRLHQGDPRTLQFCKIKDNSKCAEFDIVTWICVSRDEFNTESQTASPASTASRPVPDRCLNETLQSVSYQTCTPIQTVIYSNYCSENMTFSKMDNVQTCNITVEGRETSGLLSADLKCCSKDDTDHGWGPPDIATIPSGNKNLKNPFIYWTVEQNRTLKPDDPDLPPEWCGLEQVERQRENITSANVELMKKLYMQNEDTEGEINYDSLVAQIEQVERDLHKEEVVLYREHFNCLAGKVGELIVSSHSLLDRIAATRAREAFTTDIRAVNTSLTEVSEKFAEICSDLVEGESNDFSKDYREVVTDLQVLRRKIETISGEVESWEESNCVHCETTKQIDSNTLPPVVTISSGDSGNLGQEDKKEEDSSKLKNQKYLIAIVSTVSVITIIVALVFFIVVVRRTLHKDVSGRFTTLPSADILTNEQYVAFLQKNGYANPTCRLPQKYLDDHD